MRKNMIYSNYDFDDYKEGAIENLMENCGYESAKEIPEREIWEEVYTLQEIYWEDEKYMMKDFFEGKTLLVCGVCGLWNGNFAAGKVIAYNELWRTLNDCDYWEIYDEGGHFHIKGSHHDGTNHFEVKVLTEKGAEMWYRWENEWSVWQNCSEEEVHEKLWKNSKYSRIPHYAREVFGCKTR